MRIYKLHNNSGVLLFAFIMMLGLLILAGATMGSVYNNMKLANSQINTQQAKYMAYAGMNKAFYYLTYQDPLTAHNKDGTWRTTACSESTENVAPCTTESSASTTCTGGAPCKEVVAIGAGYGTYTMWVESDDPGIKITVAGVYPTDSSGNPLGESVKKYYRLKIRYQSYLLQWLRMDEGKGWALLDSSGNDFFMIPGSTTATWTHTTNCAITTGHCMTFTAANSYFYLAAAATLAKRGYLNPTGAMSYAAWIYLSAAPANTAQYGLLTNYSSKYGFKIYGNGVGNPVLLYRSEYNNGTLNYGTTQIPLNTWTHVAFVVDALGQNTSLKLYVNGATDALATNNTIYTAPHLYALGSDSTPAVIQGKIDDSRLYSRTLTSTEVAAIYNAGTSLAANIAAAPGYGFITVQPGSFIAM